LNLTKTPYLVLFVILGAIGITTASAVGIITLAGDVLITGFLDMTGDKITNVGTPTTSTDAATKGYVDSLFSCDGGGQSCTVGLGECQNSGINICMMESTQCSVSAGAPSTEICDTLDNDCDGTSDEDFDLNNNPNNCGACGAVCSSTNVNTLFCTSGVCTPFCDTGFGNCNNEQVFNDGCEELLDSNPSCASEFIDLGSISGDTGNQVITHTSFGEKNFRVTVTEDDISTTTCNDLGIKYRFLSNPQGKFLVLGLCDGCGGIGTPGNCDGGGNPNIGGCNQGGSVLYEERCTSGIPDNVLDGRVIFLSVSIDPGQPVNSCDTWTLEITANNDEGPERLTC